jgi:hypothetical protein
MLHSSSVSARVRTVFSTLQCRPEQFEEFRGCDEGRDEEVIDPSMQNIFGL